MVKYSQNNLQFGLRVYSRREFFKSKNWSDSTPPHIKTKVNSLVVKILKSFQYPHGKNYETMMIFAFKLSSANIIIRWGREIFWAQGKEK